MIWLGLQLRRLQDDVMQCDFRGVSQGSVNPPRAIRERILAKAGEKGVAGRKIGESDREHPEMLRRMHLVA